VEVISRAPKAILRAETSLELAIASVIDYVLPPPLPEKVLEVMRSLKWSVQDSLRMISAWSETASARSAGDHRAVEFEFLGHAYISPGNSSF
jgi:hypothetical protein